MDDACNFAVFIMLMLFLRRHYVNAVLIYSLAHTRDHMSTASIRVTWLACANVGFNITSRVPCAFTRLDLF